MRRFLRLYVLAALAGGAGWLAVDRGGFAAWYLFWFFGGLFLYAAAAFLFSLMKVSAARRLSHTVLPNGAELAVEVELRIFSLFPVGWLTITDRWVQGQEGQIFGVKHVLSPWFKRRVTFRYRVAGLPRGVYRFPDVEVTAVDLFGLLAKRRRIPVESACTVLPQVAFVESAEALRGTGAEEMAERPEEYRFREPGHSVREYAQGDPMRRIHWRATARRGDLMTRTMETPESLRLMICLDGSRSAYLAAEGIRLFEQGISAAAGLLYREAELRREAGFACNSGRSELVLPDGRPSLQRLLLLLSDLRSDGDKPLSEGLLQQADAAASGEYTLVCITPALDERLAAALTELRQRKRPVLLLHLQDKPVPSLRSRELKRRLEQEGCLVQELSLPYREREVLPYVEHEGA